jgi:hypothetical protein
VLEKISGFFFRLFYFYAYLQNYAYVGEPLWLTGRVVKNEKKMKLRGPGIGPHPRATSLKNIYTYVCYVRGLSKCKLIPHMFF